MNERKKIYVTNPYIDSKDVEAVIEVAKTKWFSQGKALWDFEDAFAIKINRRYALAVQSGSSANFLMLDTAIKYGLLKEGDEVITSPLSYITTVAPLIRFGLMPVFVDVNLDYKSPNYLTINSDIIAKMENVKAIYPVHFIGFHASEKLQYLSDVILEDCCNLGVSKKKLRGFAETYSFFPAHHLCAGEGGILASDDVDFVSIARSLREYGRTCPLVCKSRRCPQIANPEYICPDVRNRLTFTYLGWNFKMTNLSAALASSQLSKIDFFMRRRRANAKTLEKELDFLRNYGIIIPKYHKELDWFIFPIILPPEINREDLMKYLKTKRIETRRILAGNILSQPAMKWQNKTVIGNLTNSELVDKHGFAIGCHPKITKEDIEYIKESFKEYLDR